MKTLTARSFQLFAATTFLFCSPGTARASSGEDRDVRIVFLQGDVRLSRGDGKHPNLGKGWQQAESGVSIEQGFSVATGNGRAEIAFEDSGRVFLAENSLLLFRRLSAEGDLVVTRLSLVTGTATFSLEPASRESFFIDTPTEKIRVTRPESFFARMDAYLDGTALTPQGDKGDDVVRRGFPKFHLRKGQTLFFEGGEVLPLPEARGTSAVDDWDASISARFVPPRLSAVSHPLLASDWDGWISARLAERKATTAAALEASGLSSPIPGLADLYAHGTFFTCEPYGTCWEPVEQDQTPAPSAPSPAPDTNSGGTGFQPQTVDWVETNWGPCSFYASRTVSRIAHTQEELEKLLRSKAAAESRRPVNPWDSAACQTESWIPHHGHYAMVLPARPHPRCADRKCRRVHPPPVYVVHARGMVGYVPRHPDDRKGKPPINLRNGIIVPPARTGEPFGHVQWDGRAKVKILEKSPKELSGEIGTHLISAAAPKIQAHLVGETMRRVPVAAAPSVNSEIVYDYKTQRFLLSDASTTSAKSKDVAVGGITSRGEVSSFADGRSGRYAEAFARIGGWTPQAGGGNRESNSRGSWYSGGERTSGSYASGSAHSGGERSASSNSPAVSSSHASSTPSGSGGSSPASGSSNTGRGRPN